MAEVLTGVNGNILKWAREFYNMSLEEAATAIGVDYEKYCSWEDGSDFPTYAKLRKVSDVFHKPSAIFFFPEPPILPPIKGDLRTLPEEVVDGLSKNVIIQFEKAKAFVLCFPEYYCEEYEDIENEYSECESCHSKEKTNSLFYAQPKGYIKKHENDYGFAGLDGTGELLLLPKLVEKLKKSGEGYRILQDPMKFDE